MAETVKPEPATSDGAVLNTTVPNVPTSTGTTPGRSTSYDIGVELSRAVNPLVLALDIGSTSTRACVYDAQARPVAGLQAEARHQFHETAEGASEIDADAMVAEVAELITHTVEQMMPGAISAVAMDTFASSLVCVDAQGQALTPCFSYADSRSADHVRQLRARLGDAHAHQLTGVRLHTSYLPARLLWLADEHAGVWDAAARFVSLGEYIWTKLAGVGACAVSTMAWAGMLDRHTGQLSPELLEVTGTSADQFGELAEPTEGFSAVPSELQAAGSAPAGSSSASVAARWPALADAVWLPAVPDGFASNIGVGATDPATVALSAATSGALRVIVPGTPEQVPEGLWAYRVSEDASIVGGALNDVGRVVTWLGNTIAPVDAAERDAALAAAPKPGTPLVLPFLTGERATGWAGDARAVFAGVSAATDALAMWRGAIEGVAVSYARVFGQLRAVNPGMRRVVASAGVTRHFPAVLDVVTNALGVPVHKIMTERMTMRGTAILALKALGSDLPLAELPDGGVCQPDAAQADYYAELRGRFEGLYRRVV